MCAKLGKGCKDIGIRKSKFEAKTQLLCVEIIPTSSLDTQDFQMKI